MSGPRADRTASGTEQNESADPFALPPPDLSDPVTDVYKSDVDRTLLRENLALTPAERCRRFQQKMAMFYELRRAGQERHRDSPREP